MNSRKLSIVPLLFLILLALLMLWQSQAIKIIWYKHLGTAKAEKPDTWTAAGAAGYLDLYNKKLAPDRNYNSVNPINITTVKEWWQAAAIFTWYLHSPPRYKCKTVMMLKNWRICQDRPYLVKPPCLVYSFGMNQKDHRRNKNVQFYSTGLSGSNTNDFSPAQDQYVRSPQKWKMRTLKSIKEELGHEGRVIDVLKIDIESSEWQVLLNLLETDMLKYVRQLLIEYHFFSNRPPKKDYVLFIQAHTRLRQMGFREWLSTPHTIVLKNPNTFRHQGEAYYVNTRFDEGKL